MTNDLDEQLEKALDNVNEDRDVTKRLLNDLIDYISVSNERHVEAGAIAAKRLVRVVGAVVTIPRTVPSVGVNLVGFLRGAGGRAAGRHA